MVPKFPFMIVETQRYRPVVVRRVPWRSFMSCLDLETESELISGNTKSTNVLPLIVSLVSGLSHQPRLPRKLGPRLLVTGFPYFRVGYSGLRLYPTYDGQWATSLWYIIRETSLGSNSKNTLFRQNFLTK